MRGGHESSRLFMARHHQLDLRAAERFEDIEIFFSGNAEDPLHPFVLECRYQQISPVHRYVPRHTRRSRRFRGPVIVSLFWWVAMDLAQTACEDVHLPSYF